MKKFVLLMTIAALCCGICFAQNAGDFETSAANGAVTITKYTGSAQELVIPAAINGLPVTAIEESAFYRCSGLKTVTIPSSVTAIGEGAFYGCNLNPAIRSEITRRFGNAPFEDDDGGQ